MGGECAGFPEVVKEIFPAFTGLRSFAASQVLARGERGGKVESRWVYRGFNTALLSAASALDQEKLAAQESQTREWRG